METFTLTNTSLQPVLREVAPLNLLFFRTKTRVNELGSFVGTVARELYRDAVINDLEITGPVHWNYFGFNGDEQSEFVLEIALPVADIPRSYVGKFRVKRTDGFRCITLRHEGSWYDLPKSYARLMQHIAGARFLPSDENRELYINIDFLHPEANITEIQMGII